MTFVSFRSSALAGAALAVSALVGGASVPHALAAQPHPAEACVFDKFAPIAAAPYRTENGIDFGSYSHLGGAQLFVPAREGLTREWLAASVQEALARAQTSEPSASNVCDSPRVKDVSVRVVSGGTGFWVQLISADQGSSTALLKWARSITDHYKPATQTR
jgi:hypothetical protein